MRHVAGTVVEARPGGGLGSHVAVLFERGRHGQAALTQAAALAAESGAELSVVVLAPQVGRYHRCGESPDALNSALIDASRSELTDAAHDRSVPDGTRFTLLLEGHDPSLVAWVKEGGFDVVFVPSRPRLFRAPGHPAVRSLRRLAGCEVRLVAASRSRQAP
jgi:hypothetical protein